MVYLKLFSTDAERTACTEPQEYVSYTEETDKVHIHYHDYSQDYLTFVAKTSGTFNFGPNEYMTTRNNISYSTDDGVTWSEPATSATVTVGVGDKVLWKGEMTPTNNERIGVFSDSTAEYDVQGNIMSLLYGDNFVNQTDLSGKNYVFDSLLAGTKVINAENLILPATTLAESCYQSMFENCTSLTQAPELSATTLAQACYSGMFQGCTSLAQAPELPATTLANRCYNGMFKGCTSLAQAPELPGITSATFCYQSMFSGCTSLTVAPMIRLSYLANNSCSYMFSDCTSLTQTEGISATSLTSYACQCMFSGCTALTTAPELKATTLNTYCYRYMFKGCTNLNYIKMLATNNITATQCLFEWVDGVAASGTFVKAASMTTLPSGTSGIPNDWTVQDA